MLLKKDYTTFLTHPIFEYVKEAASILNIDTYVIGGFVRDLLLKRGEPKDIDIVAIGSGIELAKKVASLLPTNPKVQIFKNFGTAMLIFHNIEIEFVGARKESYHKDSRNPEVEAGSLQDDQDRRDFTINALAISLNKLNYGALLDPFNGLSDLKAKIIKTPLNPTTTFTDDPLRMLRAIRFASQLNFTINKASLNAISENYDRLEIISKERIVVELNKILMVKKPSVGLKLLYETKLLSLILPEVTDLQGVQEVEGQRHKDNFFHTLEVVDNIAKNTDNLWLRWSALLHDIGKAPTKKFSKKVGWTFHGHEFIGSKMVLKIFERLKMPLNKKMKYVQKMVLLSSRPIVLAQDDVTDSAIRRLIFDAGDDIDDLITHCEADITTKNKKKYNSYFNNFKIVRQKIKEVEERDKIRNFQPPITGKIIMETFNLKPCKEIGIIKNAIKEAILDGKIANNYKEAFNYMIKKGKSYGLKQVS